MTALMPAWWWESVPGRLGGEPVMRGTRVPVEAVLLYLQGDPDVRNCKAQFPTVPRDAITAMMRDL